MYKSTLSLCGLVTFGMEHYSEHNCKFHLKQREDLKCLYPQEPKSAVNVFVFAPSVHNPSLLTPCNLRGIDRQKGDRDETGFQLQPSDVMSTETHTQSDKNKQPIHFTLLPIPLRIPPCENYQFTPSLPPPLLCSQVFNMNQFGSITQ